MKIDKFYFKSNIFVFFSNHIVFMDRRNKFRQRLILENIFNRMETAVLGHVFEV